ncbi:MAG: AAA family ATPase [Myxococcota bacterium]
MQILGAAIDRGAAASAYLFEGPSGVGKQKTAMAMAKHLVARASSAIAQRIDDGSHPDIRVFNPRAEGARNIPVEYLRKEILPIARFAPFEAQCSFLIFPEADLSFPVQHPAAANALLKTLEEPRDKVHFILITDRPERLLDTIRSRCQRVSFGRLTTEDLTAILAKAGVASEDMGPAIALSDGRADQALHLSTAGEARELIGRALRAHDVVQRGHPGEAVLLAEEMSRMEDLSLLLRALIQLYRDVARHKLHIDESTWSLRDFRVEVVERARDLEPSEAGERVRQIYIARDLLDENANTQMVLESLLAGLKR